MGFIETSYGINYLSQLNVDNDLNLKNYDLIGVKRFVCQDYLGAVLATSSNDVKWTLNLNDLGTGGYTKTFRIPSNFVESTIKISFIAINPNPSYTMDIYLQKFDPDTETYTTIYTKTISAGAGTVTVTTPDITVKAGEVYRIQNVGHSGASVKTSSTNILCDIVPYTSGYWEIE